MTVRHSRSLSLLAGLALLTPLPPPVAAAAPPTPPVTRALPATRVTPETGSPPPASSREADQRRPSEPPSATRSTTRSEPARLAPGPRFTRRAWEALRAGSALVGTASWYPGSRGFHGRRHVAMPGADWTGHASGRVRICVDGHCVTALVVDACACYVRTRAPRLVDLSAETLAALGLDPSAGLYRVTVRLLAP